MPPELRFHPKMSLRMFVCEWDGISHVVSTPFFYFASYVKREYVFVFGAQIIHFFRCFHCSFGCSIVNTACYFIDRRWISVPSK